jgi:hypothetical protein
MVNYLVMVLLTARLFFSRRDAVMAYFKHCAITEGLYLYPKQLGSYKTCLLDVSATLTTKFQPNSCSQHVKNKATVFYKL